MNNVIEHTGFVSETTDNEIKVSITVSDACSGCGAKSSCGMVDHKSRIITLANPGTVFHVGDRIHIEGAQAMGLKAVFFAYVLPFLLVLLTLIVSLSCLRLTELLSGLYSVLILVPYYFILSLFKGKLKKKYTFRIVSE